MYHFLSGYTAKVAGTERGITEPWAYDAQAQRLAGMFVKNFQQFVNDVTRRCGLPARSTMKRSGSQ